MNFSNETNMTGRSDECGSHTEGLLAYACFIFSIHGYASLIICCFGVPTNIVNIVILTRKNLRSPINCILAGIAIADVLTMLCYMPYSIHFYIMHGLERTKDKYTYGWGWYMAVHAGLSTTTHTISIWLGVCMAVVRYIYIRSMGNNKSIMKVKNSVILVVVVYACTVLCYLPQYIIIKVHNNNGSLVLTGLNKLGASDTTWLQKTAAWVFILIGNVFPCILISIFGGLLLRSLHESKKRTLTLKGAQCANRLKQHKRTTIMLLAIIVMYIVTQLPSSILVVLCLCVENFMEETYLLFCRYFGSDVADKQFRKLLHVLRDESTVPRLSDGNSVRQHSE
ncbi:sex peptide receptor-like [Mizuhopecten yessoensis]|uniref:Thyrotropin-releasing hormone receptor n=1 Tax=Mizuhopecten yessoensis TaxID=6573 RepID=A0A210QDB4_MIZYE|nr:sex peptide receptor-like [Mizuhopecten yessoensis]OWF46712.1 Thyrotropin-releasing hormone receptor [Mizuhopecten yessoensis]